jgi:hypothetical protein
MAERTRPWAYKVSPKRVLKPLKSSQIRMLSYQKERLIGMMNLAS